MDYVIGAFAVFFVFNTLSEYLTLPKVIWTLLQTLLGLGAGFILDSDRVWLGLGVAGMASLIRVAESWLLTSGDRARLDMLRGARR
jgi:NhaP-type Na+/H+ or K+/H+ antiporter